MYRFFYLVLANTLSASFSVSTRVNQESQTVHEGLEWILQYEVRQLRFELRNREIDMRMLQSDYERELRDVRFRERELQSRIDALREETIDLRNRLARG